MSDLTITLRQQYRLDHIKSADASDGTLVDYAKAQGPEGQRPVLAENGAGTPRRHRW